MATGHFATYPIGVTEGLLEQKHYLKMKDAVWLFMWLVRRQTGANGRVLAKKFSGVTHDQISSETGWNPRTIRRWMARLIKHHYVVVRYTVFHRMQVTILNAKKFNPKQATIPFSTRPDVAELTGPQLAEIGTKSGRVKQRGTWRKIKPEREEEYTDPYPDLRVLLAKERASYVS